MRKALHIGVSIVLGVLTTWVTAVIGANRNLASVTMISGAAGPAAPTWTFRQWRTFGTVSSNYGPCFETRQILAYDGSHPELVGWWSRMRTTPARTDYAEGDLGYVWFNETAMGWPAATFISTARYDGRQRGKGNYQVGTSGRATWEIGSRSYVVPYTPLWRAFLPMAAACAGAWWLLIGVPLALLRRFRRKEGHCPACGYDLRGSPGVPCPECGRVAA